MDNVASNRRLASGRILISTLALALVMAVPTLAAVTPEMQRAIRGALAVIIFAGAFLLTVRLMTVPEK